MIGADALLATAPGVRDFDWTDEDYRRYANCVGGDGILPGFPTVVAWIVPPTFTTLGAGAVVVEAAVLVDGVVLACPPQPVSAIMATTRATVSNRPTNLRAFCIVPPRR